MSSVPQECHLTKLHRILLTSGVIAFILITPFSADLARSLFVNLGNINLSQSISWSAERSLLTLGATVTNAQRLARSIDHFRMATSWSRNGVDARANQHIALAYIFQRDYLAALAILKQSVSSCTDNASTHELLAAVYGLMGDNSAMIQELGKAGATQQLQQFGEQAISNKDWETAILAFQTAVQATPRSIKAYQDYAYALYWGKDNEEQARAQLAHAIEMDPHNIRSYLLMGDLMLDKKRFAEALHWYERAREIEPDEIRSYTAIGDVYREQQVYGEARRWYRLAQTLNPKSDLARKHLAESYVAEGNLYRDQGKWDKALELYKMGIEVDSKYSRAYEGYGVALHRGNGDVSGALATLYQATQLDPKAIGPYIKIGEIYREQHNFVTADLWYRKALVHDIQGVTVFSYLGLNYFDQEKYTIALEYFQKAVIKGSASPWNHYWLGKTYHSLGLYGQATAELKEAINRGSGNVWFHNALGDAYRDTDQTEAAIAEYRHALGFSPDNQYAMLQLAQLGAEK